MSAPKEVLNLIEKFELHREDYLSGRYNEAQVRKEFIDPMFKALGWDMDNEGGLAEAYKDVIHEDAIKMGGFTKAPDYCFRIGGTRKFFLEAKKPSVKLKDDTEPAFQLRRYAWTGKLPLSILTDFEELAVYDCRVKPVKTDGATTARTMYLTCDEYAERWDEIASVFSKDAVLKGSFDKYAASATKKRGTAEVDKAFLKEIESWRETLAKSLALRNPALSTEELNYAVQTTIDRIIFLRICEDRGIEDYGRLMALRNGANTYPRLMELFRAADQRYNSGLFHFEREKGRPESPDGLTPGLAIDDKPLKDIIKSLYYPDSPYEFSVLPADILGQVYEQFLGKVIRLTAGHRAVVEDKPEVKKAGGVYYTPTYIVDYIVKNTVGKLIEGKKPAQVAKLRILDPACGSGSFLIGAYQYLIDWHRDWYAEHDPKKHAKQRTPAIYQGAGGEWRLTTAEKKRILLNNIYGVDIDPQAVEVTKLSLLLKVLEGESQLSLFHERALPDLGDNIKCGNSLIGTDFYEGEQMALFDDEERRRVNAFDWETEFPEIMAAGGFDAVIGNPPYAGFHGFMSDKDYLKQRYVSATGRFDYYVPFLELGLANLKSNGILGFICPTNFMKREHGKALRSHLRQSAKLLEVCDFEDVQVFGRALNYTGIFMIQKARPGQGHLITYRRRSLDDSGIRVPQSQLNDDIWVFQDSTDRAVVERMRAQAVATLAEISSAIGAGVVTGNDSVFLVSREEAQGLGLESEVVRRCLRGKDVRRYWIHEPEQVVLYPYALDENRTRILSDVEMRAYPNAWRYLVARREELVGRSYFDVTPKKWYELWRPRDLRLLEAPKIVVPELAESSRFAIADATQFYGDTVCAVTLRRDIREDLKYVLGLLNSGLIDFYYKRMTVPKANAYYIYKTMFLKELPIRRINFSDAEDVTRHDRMVKLVSELAALRNQQESARTMQDRTTIQRRADSIDGRIDRLAHELYGMTRNEITIMERAVTL